MNGVLPISEFLSAGRSIAPKGPRGEYGFSDALRQAVEHVNQLQTDAGKEIQALLTGESEDVHKTVLSVQKADMAIETLLEVRNKVVQAYQEVMRIQV